MRKLSFSILILATMAGAVSASAATPRKVPHALYKVATVPTTGQMSELPGAFQVPAWDVSWAKSSFDPSFQWDASSAPWNFPSIYDGNAEMRGAQMALWGSMNPTANFVSQPVEADPTAHQAI